MYEGGRDERGGGRGRRGGGGGRGAYYKAKYGGGRGRGGRGSLPEELEMNNAPDDSLNGAGAQGGPIAAKGSMQDLQRVLRSIDGRGYPAYRDLEGAWQFPDFTLLVDRVQADPFAAPSRFRVQVPQQKSLFPSSSYSPKIRNVALCDFLTRRFCERVASSGADARQGVGGGWGAAKGGELCMEVPGQAVLERSSFVVSATMVEARFTVALPAQGRTVLGQWAASILVTYLPGLVRDNLYWDRQDQQVLKRHLECVEDAEWLRNALPGAGLAAFVANGSILPRRSGASDLPMERSQVVPFASPPTLLHQFLLPNRGKVQGMGIQTGVTVLVGGGFHGKSTLLEALEVGVYCHIPGDGRELVVADPSTLKVRAEDGRSVAGSDISAFICNLPQGKDTASFSTPDASGSTSQAASLVEGLEVGACTLLLDEDTCASNFMTRDQRMQALVAPEKEPITPFISRIRSLVTAFSASVIIVMGSTGDFFSVADCVIMMDCYTPKDVTQEAKAISERFSQMQGGSPGLPAAATFRPPAARLLMSLFPAGQWDVRVKTKTKASVSLGEEELDLSALVQLVEKSQTRAVADALLLIQKKFANGRQTIAEVVTQLEAELDARGLDALAPSMHLGTYSRPRKVEIAAAMSRIRTLQVQQRQVPR